MMRVRYSGKVKNENTNAEKDLDYILSPAVGQDGKQFDSRQYGNSETDLRPCDGDANGAYNIARKGLMIAEKI